jgi:Pyruvate/2-oxoacid:ferredoxin oxidoreductase delta subunit
LELTAPVEIEPVSGGFRLVLQNMKASGRSKDGRARVEPDGGPMFDMKVAGIYSAIGADAKAQWNLLQKEDGRQIKMSHCALQKSDFPVIFGGDLANDVKSVTDAIASGKQAAMALDILFDDGRDAVLQRLNTCYVEDGPALSMDIYLNGDRRLRSSHVVSSDEINTDYFEEAGQVESKVLDASVRRIVFDEIEDTLKEEAAFKEADRCFNCGLCNDCDTCRIFCPEMSVVIGSSESPGRHINLDYCKGCGICVVECPRNAMVLEEETG